MFAKASRGEVSKADAIGRARASKGKDLPERVEKKASSELDSSAKHHAAFMESIRGLSESDQKDVIAQMMGHLGASYKKNKSGDVLSPDASRHLAHRHIKKATLAHMLLKLAVDDDGDDDDASPEDDWLNAKPKSATIEKVGFAAVLLKLAEDDAVKPPKPLPKPKPEHEPLRGQDDPDDKKNEQKAKDSLKGAPPIPDLKNFEWPSSKKPVT